MASSVAWNLWLSWWEFTLPQHMFPLLFLFLPLFSYIFSSSVFFPLVISSLPVAMVYNSQSERYRRGLSVFQSCYSGPASPNPHPPEDQTNGEQGQHLEHSLRGLLAEDGEVGGEWFGTLLSKAIKYLISWGLCFIFFNYRITNMGTLTEHLI